MTPAEPHHAPPAPAAEAADPPKPGTTNMSSSSSCSPYASSSGAAAAGLAPPGAKTEAASPGRSRAQKRVVWSFEAETRRCPSGWNVRAQTFESCAWESVARGGICGAGAESVAVLGDAACDDGEVEVVAVEVGVGVPGAGEERSQWRIAPSEPPETRIG
jgi:hypothetical protein